VGFGPPALPRCVRHKRPPNGRYEVLDRATTTAAGRIEATLTIPQWAADEESLVFVVETDRVRLTSEPIDIIRNM